MYRSSAWYFSFGRLVGHPVRASNFLQSGPEIVGGYVLGSENDAQGGPFLLRHCQ